jgi:hypothetical protein
MIPRWIIVCLGVLLSLSIVTQAQNLPHEQPFDPETYEEPEEIVIKREDLDEWLGTNERDELHAVGACWQSEMVRCVRECENTTLPIEILEEICASYCQADVTWMCTKLNLDYGGSKIFKFAGRWPFKRVWIFSEFGSVLFCSLSVVMHMYYLYEYRSKTKSHRTDG